ncbi:MAG TPA: superoxide dismutase family protein [Burkholderiales bacterium]|jgi:Cu-Zn family superoxide dismutase
MKKCVLAAACGAVLATGCAMMEEKDATATAVLEPRSGSNVRGTVTFTQAGDVVRVSGTVTGHSKGPRGFHIHAMGDCSAHDAMSAGGHFNPTNSKHGGPYDPVRHAGDLGNLNFGADGTAKVNFVVGDISVRTGQANDIVGRALMVHADRDDLKTDPTGNAGGRVACGVIK